LTSELWAVSEAEVLQLAPWDTDDSDLRTTTITNDNGNHNYNNYNYQTVHSVQC